MLPRPSTITVSELMRTNTLIVLALTLLLLGCGEARRGPAATENPGPLPDSDIATRPAAASAAGDLCAYRERKDPVIAGYQDQAGNAWSGEIRPQDRESLETKYPGPFDRRIATAVAKPRVAVYRARVDDNCYDAARRVYYSCTRTIEADVAPVRGFARALEMTQAHALARQLCEKKVREIAEKALELRVDSLDLRCTIAEDAFCALPPAPPPRPVKK